MRLQTVSFEFVVFGNVQLFWHGGARFSTDCGVSKFVIIWKCTGSFQRVGEIQVRIQDFGNWKVNPVWVQKYLKNDLQRKIYRRHFTKGCSCGGGGGRVVSGKFCKICFG